MDEKAPAGIITFDRDLTYANVEEITRSFEEAMANGWVVLPTIDPDFPDSGRYENENWPPWRRRRRAQRRRAQLEAEIAVLECELGIHCDQDPCRHWLKMESVW